VLAVKLAFFIIFTLGHFTLFITAPFHLVCFLTKIWVEVYFSPIWIRLLFDFFSEILNLWLQFYLFQIVSKYSQWIVYCSFSRTKFFSCFTNLLIR
jgi:hypothetical protein